MSEEGGTGSRVVVRPDRDAGSSTLSVTGAVSDTGGVSGACLMAVTDDVSRTKEDIGAADVSFAVVGVSESFNPFACPVVEG